ncbi:hypothetical protein ACFV1C_02605 [Streptomyces sp. NPDC059605]|uniref:hypothetical protein n=1 Tax=unclassified Streptomyces TaxID=2593676 RepID=UPI003673ECA6
MVARITGRYDAALSHAERGARLAPACLARALLHAWALLPALARLHRADEADQALRTALAELEADPSGTAPGRFGFDEPELALHQAEADLALGRHQQARTRAEASCAACPDGTGGWAAATLVLAQAEAAGSPQDAVQRALHVLDHVPAARLRSTARTRLHHTPHPPRNRPHRTPPHTPRRHRPPRTRPLKSRRPRTRSAASAAGAAPVA